MIFASEFLKWLEIFKVQFGSNAIPIPVPMSYGGTGAVLTPSANSLVYSTSSALALLATADNSVLITSSLGVPLLSTVLPAGLTTTDPTLAQGLATKNYVDQIALTGTSVYAATTTNLNVVQLGAGVGATLTDASGTFAPLTLDGVAVPLNSNFLVKNLAAPQHEGIYKLTTNGDGLIIPWQGTRATTYDTPAEINNTGLIIVINGDTQAGEAWYNSTNIVTVDTTNFDYNELGNITFPISLSHGGTGANLTANNGGIFYSNATTGAILAGTSTANQILLSGSSTAPAWSTAVYPATTTVNELLFSSATNVISGISTLSNGVLVTDNSGVPQLLANGTAGYFLVANAGAPPSWQLLASRGAITQIDTDSGNITPSAGVVTISGGSTGLTTSGSGSTIDLAGILNLASGGTNNSLIASLGGIIWSDASKLNVLAGTATGNQLLLSGSSAMPSWSTTTYPTTNAANTLLYASAANAMAALATANSSVLVTDVSGVPSLSTTLPAGLTIPGYQTTITFPIALSLGGTNANLTASNGGIFYSTATAGAILSGTATATQMLQSGSSTAPVWSTSTWPATTTINQLLYSSSANTVAGLATVSSAVLTTVVGVPTWASELSLALGGTNAALTASNGGIVYSTASALAILGGTATAGQILQSGASTTPSWSTATYPATAGTSTNVLTSDGTNWNSTSVAGLGSPLTTKGDLYTFSTVNARLAVATGDGKILQVSSGASTGLAYSTPTYPSASGTAGQLLRSDGTNNLYTTSTYPNTNAINTLLYASATNVMSALATANSGVLVTSSTGVPSILAAGTTGQVLQASTSGTPAWSTPTYPSTSATARKMMVSDGTNWVASTETWAVPGSSGNILTSDGTNWTSAAPAASGFTYNDVSGTTQAAAVNNGYIISNAAQTTVTLPATAAEGSVVAVQGKGAAGWILAANTGQTIHVGNAASTSGGSWTSSNQWDAINVVCVTANTTWAAISSVGNLTPA